jgi:hypothetical protein
MIFLYETLSRIISSNIMLSCKLISTRAIQSIVIFSFTLLICCWISENGQKAYSQIIPLPPPAQQPSPSQTNLAPNQFKNDTSSPIIKVVTPSLVEGGNIFKAKITDESPITTAQIAFVQSGQIVTQSLVKDPQDIFKALIYVHPPSAVIITSAFDIHGNTASVAKYLTVTPLSRSIHDQVTSFLSNIGKGILSLFGLTKG